MCDRVSFFLFILLFFLVYFFSSLSLINSCATTTSLCHFHPFGSHPPFGCLPFPLFSLPPPSSLVEATIVIVPSLAIINITSLCYRHESPLCLCVTHQPPPPPHPLSPLATPFLLLLFFFLLLTHLPLI